MIQLYKERDFGAIISDSLNFFKKNGKNYFKNYLAINGGILLLLLLIAVIGFKDIISQLFESNMGNKSFYFEQYFNENTGVFLTVCFVLFIIGIILYIVNYSFPIIYLKLIGEQNRNDFTVNEIVTELKKNINKILIFGLFSVFILTPVAMIVFGVNMMLTFIIIGIFTFILSLPTLMNIFNFTLFDYLSRETSIFNSFKTAFKIQFSKNFWKYIGCSLIIYLILNVISSVFTFIPIFILGIASGLKVDGVTSDILPVLMIITYSLSIIISFIASNILYVTNGLMYFDSRKDLHQKEYLKEIDSIGRR